MLSTDALGTDGLGPALIARARNAIAAVFDLPTIEEPPHVELSKPGASFVTLRCASELRGCIGSLEPVRSLDEDVRFAARAAAFSDPRFEPLRVDEFALLRIEVSVIGAAAPVFCASEAEALLALRPFVDGVTLRWRNYGSTLLPQVWSSVPQPFEFLQTLKRKAGLPANFWAADIELSRYSAVHYEEASEIVA